MAENTKYAITATLTGCVADSTNPVEIETGNTAQLKYTTKFPRTDFAITVTGATADKATATGEAVTITLSNPTDNVNITVVSDTAKDSSSTRGIEKYEIAGAVIYWKFDNRQRRKWCIRWIKRNY